MPVWGWFVIGGIPALGLFAAAYRLLSKRKRDRGINPLTPGQVKSQKERLRDEQDRIRKDRDAAESADLADWRDRVRRRREEANASGSGEGDPGAG